MLPCGTGGILGKSGGRRCQGAPWLPLGEVWVASPAGSSGKGGKAWGTWAGLLQWWGQCPASSSQFPELGQIQVAGERTSVLPVLFPAPHQEPLGLVVVAASARRARGLSVLAPQDCRSGLCLAKTLEMATGLSGRASPVWSWPS